MEALYNLQAFRHTTSAILTLNLAETTGHLRVLSLAFQQQGANLAQAQQDVVTYQNQVVQMKIERGDHFQQIFDLQNDRDFLQAQLAASEAQRLALVQHVDGLQQQVIDAEIDVEAMNAYVAIIQ